jgi:hypothetical protein
MKKTAGREALGAGSKNDFAFYVFLSIIFGEFRFIEH